jgi:hypothetical protein
VSYVSNSSYVSGVSLSGGRGVLAWTLPGRAAKRTEQALTGRGPSHTVWLSKIIGSIEEASEVTRQWRTLNISQS